MCQTILYIYKIYISITYLLLNYQNGFGQQAPEGLPVQLPLLSEQLQANGYNNSVLGKWHVGFCRYREFHKPCFLKELMLHKQ